MTCIALGIIIGVTKKEDEIEEKQKCGKKREALQNDR
jgi:cell division protein FtsW